jgi:hypothetical protein
VVLFHILKESGAFFKLFKGAWELLAILNSKM